MPTARNFFLTSLLLLAPCFVAQAQRQAASADANSLTSCSKLLISYTDWPKVKDPSFSLDLSAPSSGRLYYFGAEHSSDPSHAQFAAIEAAWNKLKPTIAFYEGPNRPIAATGEETIKQAGESGFVRFLAARDNVPTFSLEPSPQDEARYVLQNFPVEQVKLFYVLRETARLRERKKMTEPELRAAIAQLLERASKMGLFGDASMTLDELDASYRRYWSDPPNWWQAPQRWFDPLASSKETGGIFTNDINRASSEYRNLHMYNLLAKATTEGKRVFAVVGHNHVPLQAPALRCALQ